MRVALQVCEVACTSPCKRPAAACSLLLVPGPASSVPAPRHTYPTLHATQGSSLDFGSRELFKLAKFVRHPNIGQEGRRRNVGAPKRRYSRSDFILPVVQHHPPLPCRTHRIAGAAIACLITGTACCSAFLGQLSTCAASHRSLSASAKKRAVRQRPS